MVTLYRYILHWETSSIVGPLLHIGASGSSFRSVTISELKSLFTCSFWTSKGHSQCFVTTVTSEVFSERYIVQIRFPLPQTSCIPCGITHKVVFSSLFFITTSKGCAWHFWQRVWVPKAYKYPLPSSLWPACTTPHRWHEEILAWHTVGIGILMDLTGDYRTFFK